MKTKLLKTLLAGTYFFTLVSFLHSAESAAVRIPPLLWYERDPQTQTSFLMALLLYWREKEPGREFDLLAPLYYRYSAGDEKTRMIFPIHFLIKDRNSEIKIWGPYFSKDSLRAQTRFVFPLYFSFKDEDSKTKVLLPVYWSYKDSLVSRGILIPYYWHFSKDKRTEIGFPLYWHFLRKKENTVKDWQVAVPWVRHRSNGNSFRTFFPVYWGRTKQIEIENSADTAKKTWDLLFPLYMSSKNPDGSRKKITPFFSRFLDADGKKYGHTLVNMFSEDPWGGKSEWLFPLLFTRQESDFFSVRLLPYYMKQNKDGNRLEITLFPVFKYRKDYDRKQFLVPGMYFDRDPFTYRGQFLAYFWNTKRDPLDPAHPVLLRKRFLVPLVWHYQSPEQKTSVLAPFLVSHQQGPNSLSMAAPFYFRVINEETQTTVIPPFISRKFQDRSWMSFFPVVWKSQRADRTSLTIFPLYRRSQFPQGTSFFFPGLYYLKEETGQSQGWILAYLWDRRGATRYEIFPPIYVRWQRPDWRLKTIFPFYGFQNPSIRERGFFPLIAKTDRIQTEKTKDQNTVSTFLADSHRFLPFYFYRKLEPGYDLWLPIFLGRIECGQAEDGGKTIRGRLFLVSYWERTPDQFMNRIDPIFVYYRSPNKKGWSVPTAPFALWRYEKEILKDETIVHGALFPYYWRSSKNERMDFFFPLYYRKSEKGSADNPPKLSHVVFPVWWHFQKDQESKLLVFPLLYKSSDLSAQKSTTVSILGYLHYRDRVTSSRLIGNTFLKKSKINDEKIRIFFPLYWNFAEKNRAFSYFLPLYLRHEREDFKWKTVFPVFWKFKTAETKIKVLPPVFTIESVTTGTKTSGFAPLWTYSRNRREDWMNFQFLGGLFAFERKEGAKQITIFYLIRI